MNKRFFDEFFGCDLEIPASRKRVRIQTEQAELLPCLPHEIWSHIFSHLVGWLHVGLVCRTAYATFDKLHYGPARLLCASERLKHIGVSNKRYSYLIGTLQPFNLKLLKWVEQHDKLRYRYLCAGMGQASTPEDLDALTEFCNPRRSLKQKHAAISCLIMSAAESSNHALLEAICGKFSIFSFVDPHSLGRWVFRSVSADFCQKALALFGEKLLSAMQGHGPVWAAEMGSVELFEWASAHTVREFSTHCLQRSVVAASAYGQLEFLRWLRDSPHYFPDVSTTTRCITSAIAHGHLGVVQYLASDYGGPDFLGINLLFASCAVEHRRWEIFEWLAANGAKIDFLEHHECDCRNHYDKIRLIGILERLGVDIRDDMRDYVL
jgi:hypothetical protein